MVNLKSIRERFAGIFTRGAAMPAPITDSSSLHDIAQQHDHVYDFIERKYGVKPDASDRQVSLRDFVLKYGLPPAQILFMEVQMSSRAKGVQSCTAQQAKGMLDSSADVAVLDVRESWETKLAVLPRSRPLSPALLDEILTTWARNRKMLLYCHHGVRSLDAAAFLVDRGFTEVYTLEGGIEAWSVNVDPSVRRYEGNWC